MLKISKEKKREKERRTPTKATSCLTHAQHYFFQNLNTSTMGKKIWLRKDFKFYGIFYFM